MLKLYHNCNCYTVPTSQSKVTIMKSDDNQPRQDDESSLVEHTNGLYISTCVGFYYCICKVEMGQYRLQEYRFIMSKISQYCDTSLLKKY